MGSGKGGVAEPKVQELRRGAEACVSRLSVLSAPLCPLRLCGEFLSDLTSSAGGRNPFRTVWSVSGGAAYNQDLFCALEAPMFTHREVVHLKRRLSDPGAVCLALGLATGRTSLSGSWVSCPNPRHPDTRPSCLVSTGPAGTLRFKCFSCGVHGDVFDLIALLDGVHGRPDAFARAMEVAHRLADRMPSSSGPDASIAVASRT